MYNPYAGYINIAALSPRHPRPICTQQHMSSSDLPPTLYIKSRQAVKIWRDLEREERKQSFLALFCDGKLGTATKMKLAILTQTIFLYQEMTCFGSKRNWEKDENFEQLYKQGQEAYLENNFKLCVEKMEAALEDYKHYRKVISNCKLECHRKTHSKQSVVKHIKEVMPFEKLIHETLCLMKCKERQFGKNREEYASESTRTDFEKKKPYDYLQLCYYQTGQLQRAADAAFTHHTYNLDYNQMRDNLKFYMDLPEVNNDLIEDLEEEQYVKSYLRGTDHYRDKEWKLLTETMEQALQVKDRKHNDKSRVPSLDIYACFVERNIFWQRRFAE